MKGKESLIPPETTATGSLMRYVSMPNGNFQPMHVSYALMPELEERIRDKKVKKEKYSQRAVAAIDIYAETISKE